MFVEIVPLWSNSRDSSYVIDIHIIFIMYVVLDYCLLLKRLYPPQSPCAHFL